MLGGLEDTRLRVTPADAERIVRLVAHHVGVEVHAGSPRVSAELPESGERFEGLVPPVVAAPCFAIRCQAVAVFTLDDYVAARVMSALQAELLRAAVRERKNILVAGARRVEGRPVVLNSNGVVVDLDSEMRQDRRSGALAAIDYIVAEFLDDDVGPVVRPAAGRRRKVNSARGPSSISYVAATYFT